MRRVVVTGTGSHNALGSGTPAFLAGLREGRCAIGEMTLFPTEGYRTHRAAVAPEAALPRPLARRLSRSDRMAVACAREAWAAAGIRDGGVDPARLGVVIGGTTGGILEAEERLRRSLEGRRLGGVSLVTLPVSSTGDVIASFFDARGPRVAVSTACSSSLVSIGLAADAIQEGRADVMLAGGVDAHCRMTFAGFNCLQAIDPDVCRPFDRRRAGLSLGEGAAILVLEAEEHARARGAGILAEVAGWGASADAYHMTAPRPDGAGAVAAMRRALAEAGVDPREIDYVNAHGTGTPQNDPVETRAIREVFGAGADSLLVSSTKSQVGHCLGAAGAVGALATILAIVHGFVPPTANLEEPDPECDLDCVPRVSRPKEVRAALANAYGFGGNDASLCLRAVQ